MSEKKYIGGGFVGNFENSANIEISIPQLAKALGIDEKKFKALFLECYDAKLAAFNTPALYVKKFTTKTGIQVKELTLKIQSNAKMGDVKQLSVTLNEFVSQAKTVPAQNVKVAEIEEAFPAANDDDDLPF